MEVQTAEHSVDPSEEAIQLEPLGVHFLITGVNRSDSIALFELTVGGGRD